MLQLLQQIKSGEIELVETPPPQLAAGSVRVRTYASLISAGTEKYVLEMGRKSLLGKASARPDLVRQVVEKARKEGWLNTFYGVRARLESPAPLGYSAAGVVEAVGTEVTDISLGDRVAIAGAGYANHAEINCVPQNLVVKLPSSVGFDDAAYTTVASIALQGVRLARPQMGEFCVVVGLGLVGLVLVQLLRANGCRVIGVDLDPRKIELGLKTGMEKGVQAGEPDAAQAVSNFTAGRGADRVFICAATESSQPIEFAGEVARNKGQVVVVGNVGMNVPRRIYYEKELELKVSMSYGPGRYDPSYEEGGVDYPYEFVRWTERRNMEAFVQLMAGGGLNVSRLTTHRFRFEDALQAYSLIENGSEPYVGMLLQYDVEKQASPVVRLKTLADGPAASTLRVGFVGAGNYARLHLLSHLSEHRDAVLTGLATATGVSARSQGDKHGFAFSTTDPDKVLTDEDADAVFIATRHATHAEYAIRALGAGKHVFVEKPMVVSEEQLEQLIEAYESANSVRPVALMVGLNRRFAPMTLRIKEACARSGPLQMCYRVNSGPIPTDHWWHLPEEGGGALVGEMCHFLDVMQFLCDERPAAVQAQNLRLQSNTLADDDNLVITVTFEGGSVGVLCYNTVGSKAYSKEHLQVFGGGKTAVLDDFRRLYVASGGRTRRTKSFNQDKGQKNQINQVVDDFRSGRSPIEFQQLVDNMKTVFAARSSLRTGERVTLAHPMVDLVDA